MTGRQSARPPLVAGKWALPDPATDFVSRPRLGEALDHGTRRKLTIVSGPAGAGKTELIAAWAAQPHRDHHVAWLTLDRYDNDPAMLWRYLLASLKGADDTRHSSGADVTGWVSQLRRPVVLVLDNADAPDGAQAQGVIAGLLCAELPQLRLVFATRRKLTLPEGRLRLAGQLIEISVDDLACTAEETAAMCAAQGIPLAQEESRALVEHTDGLAAAIRLHAKAKRASIHNGQHGDDELAAFVRSEIYLAQPPEVRDFLLRSSVSRALSSDLCRVLTGRRDAGLLLRRLLDDGLMSWTDSGRSTMRIREPLLGFLRAEAPVAIGPELRGLDLKAARWFARHNEVLSAMWHAVHAGDWAFGSRLVVSHVAPSIAGSDAARLREAFVDMPAGQVHQQPESAAVKALLLAGQDVPERADGYLELARRELSRLPVERSLALHAMLDLVAVILGGEREDFDAVEDAATRLIASLRGPIGAALPAAPQLTAIAMAGLGMLHLWAGRVDDAETTLRGAIASSDHDHLELVSAWAHSGLAILEALRGNVSAAEQRAAEAGGLLARAGTVHPADVVPGQIARGVVHWLRGESAEAVACVEQAADVTRTVRRTEAIPLAALRARMLMSNGDIPAARAVLADAQALGADSRTRLLDSWLANTKAVLHLAEGRPINAMTALEGAGDECTPPLGGGRQILRAQAYLASAAPGRAAQMIDSLRELDLPPWAETEAWLVKALTADRLDHPAAARMALTEAVGAAASEGLVSPILDGGPAVRQLLGANRDLLEVHAPLAARFNGGAVHDRKDARASASITDRESTVLRYLPMLLTRNEIAQELSVSANTVKAQMRSLYHKLGVTTRREAVDRARALGLLK